MCIPTTLRQCIVNTSVYDLFRLPGQKKKQPETSFLLIKILKRYIDIFYWSSKIVQWKLICFLNREGHLVQRYIAYIICTRQHARLWKFKMIETGFFLSNCLQFTERENFNTLWWQYAQDNLRASPRSQGRRGQDKRREM